MVYVSEHESERHLRFLSQLLGAFSRPQVFQVLLRPEEMKPEMGSELRPLTENAAVHFLLQRVAVWLKQEDRKDTDFLVDMVFSSLQCCSSGSDKTLILNQISVRDTHGWGALAGGWGLCYVMFCWLCYIILLFVLHWQHYILFLAKVV